MLQTVPLKRGIYKNKEPSHLCFSIFQNSQNLICASEEKEREKQIFKFCVSFFTV